MNVDRSGRLAIVSESHIKLRNDDNLTGKKSVPILSSSGQIKNGKIPNKPIKKRKLTENAIGLTPAINDSKVEIGRLSEAQSIDYDSPKKNSSNIHSFVPPISYEEGPSAVNNAIISSNTVDLPLKDKLEDLEAPIPKTSQTFVKMIGQSTNFDREELKEKAKPNVSNKERKKCNTEWLLFYRTLSFKAFIDSAALALLWVSIAALVYTSPAWWLLFSILFTANFVTIISIYLAAGQINSRLSRIIMLVYSKTRVVFIVISILFPLGVLIMSIICFTIDTDNLLRDDSNIWTSFAIFYLIKSGVYAILPIWFLATQRSFIRQLADKLKIQSLQVAPYTR